MAAGPAPGGDKPRRHPPGAPTAGPPCGNVWTRYHRLVKTVAVIGASPDRHKFGNKALRAFAEAGYNVVPITPHHQEVEGKRAYASVLDYPDAIDMATVYVPPDIGEQVIESLAKKGIIEVWFNPGADSRPLITKARALGLEPVQACSIIAIGMSPAQF
jgi:predicted CoA-binding protein